MHAISNTIFCVSKSKGIIRQPMNTNAGIIIKRTNGIDQSVTFNSFSFDIDEPKKNPSIKKAVGVTARLGIANIELNPTKACFGFSSAMTMAMLMAMAMSGGLMRYFIRVCPEKIQIPTVQTASSEPIVERTTRPCPFSPHKYMAIGSGRKM